MLAYMVLVLPEPVGPAIKTMPQGEWISFIHCSNISGIKPTLSSVSSMSLSSTRSTAISPWTVLMVATRKSISRPSTLIENWPSWGRRLSAMFRFDSTLMREMSGAYTRLGRRMASWSTPSMR